MDGKDTSKKDPPKGLEHTTPPRSGTLITATSSIIAHAVEEQLHHHANIPPDPPTTIKQPPDQDESRDKEPASNAETTQPLAPPPRPAPAQQNTAETPDYFSSVHNSSHFSLEPNPFEQSFGNPASETPGKSLLPPVAALASPAPLLGGASSASGYNWTNSLRSGPLSPAMLSGPTGGDYFDGHLRGGFPTPNESSLRTGLTPGGGGSMFPAPSPNSQALYQQLANGGATPGTLDFHRTAMNVVAARKTENYNHLNGATSQPQEQKAPTANMDQTSQQQQQQAFGQHDNDAANGLFLLAQAGNGTQQNNQFAIPNQPSATHAHPSSLPSKSHETSPNLAKRVARNASIGGSISGSARGVSEMSGEMSDDGETQAKPNTRAKGKRNSTGKGTQASNGRRKAEETPSKAPAAKKVKTSSEVANMDLSMDGMDSDEENNIKEEQYNENGKKMTDEEKRKNFLERNR